MEFKGIFPILPTPFTDSGEVDEQSIESLVSFMVERHMDGVTVLGMMGEASKLSESEQDLVITRVVSGSSGIPVVVGAGAASTRLATQRATRAVELGASGLLVAPPPTQNEAAIFNYYRDIASSVPAPIVLHDYPEVTGVRMSAKLIARMALEIPGVDYVKLEEAPTGKKITELKEVEGSDIAVFGALGGVYCLEELRRGAIGIMTGFAYPEILRNIYLKHVSGDDSSAESEFYRAVALMRYEFQPVLGLPLRKEIYKRRGAIQSSYLRPPGPALDPIHFRELDSLIAHVTKGM